VYLRARDSHGTFGEDSFARRSPRSASVEHRLLHFSDNPEWAKANLRLEVNCRYSQRSGAVVRR